VRADKSNVNQAERGVFDLRDDTISISLYVKNDPIVRQEVIASKRGTQFT